MKNIILILFLSFVALSCSKDNTLVEEDNRIKNEIPSELLGKWKEVAQRESANSEGDDENWYSISTNKEYNWYFKEYSICCSSETEQNCDTYFVSTFDTNRISITECNGNSYKHITRFKLLKGNELILSGVGIDTIIDTKYVKVE